MFAAAVAQCVVLDPAAYLVDAVVRQADHVERIGDLVGLRQRHLEAAPIRPERSKVPQAMLSRHAGGRANSWRYHTAIGGPVGIASVCGGLRC